MKEKLLDLLEDVAKNLYLTIREPQGVKLPEGFEWVRDLILQTPITSVTLRVIGSEKNAKMILSMPVGFSREHRQAIQGLPPDQRIALIARMLTTLVTICPECRVGVGGTPVDPQGVVIEKMILGKPGRQELADSINKLYNAFLAVNAILWEKFPAVGYTPQGTIYT